MGFFGDNQTITTTFAGKDNLSPVVRGMRSTMAGFKKDAATGFGLGAGISVFGLAKQAIGEVADYLGQAAKAAIEDEKSVARLTTTLKANLPAWDGSTDAIDAFIEKGQLLAFTDDALRDSINLLTPATHDLTEALDLTSLAMDLARAKEIDLSAAALIVLKAYTGQIGMLRRLGLAIDKNATSTEALAVLQRMVAGQAESFAATSAGTFEGLSIAMDELQEDIGRELLPVMVEVAKWARDELVPAVKDLFRTLAENRWVFDLISGMLSLKTPGSIALDIALPDASDIARDRAAVALEIQRTRDDVIRAMAGTAGELDLSRLTEEVESEVAKTVKVFQGIPTGLQGALKAAKKEAHIGMAALKWAFEHPWAEKRLESFYERKMREAMHALTRAQRQGNEIAMDQARDLRDFFRQKLHEMGVLTDREAARIGARLRSITAGILDTLDIFGDSDIGELRIEPRHRKRRRRAGGGSSIALMAAPTAAMGAGGGGDVYLDGERVGKVLDRRNGRALAMYGVSARA